MLQCTPTQHNNKNKEREKVYHRHFIFTLGVLKNKNKKPRANLSVAAISCNLRQEGCLSLRVQGQLAQQSLTYLLEKRT
jgi:hypothetical protein